MALPVDCPDQDDLNRYLDKFWLAGFFKSAAEVDISATLAHFEAWQIKIRKDPRIFHEPSQTFRGGLRCLVWVVLPLLKVIANIGTSEANILTPPFPAPESFELDRLSTGDWKRAVGWLETWLQLIVSSNEVLAKTVMERLRPADAAVDDVDGRESDSEGVALEDASSTRPSKRRKTAPKPKPKPKPQPKPKPMPTPDSKSAKSSEAGESDTEMGGKGMTSGNTDVEMADDEDREGDEDEESKEDQESEKGPSDQEADEAPAAGKCSIQLYYVCI
jgi:hypothetical protein